MLRNSITLKKIAIKLNVSISTVSKALKDSHEISADTREKIKAYARINGYRPNSIALSLKNQKTKTIGIIIPDIVNDTFSKVIEGVDQIAKKKGYNIMISSSNESLEKEAYNLKTLSDSQTDGFILSLSKETMLNKNYNHINYTIKSGIPIVLFDRVSDDIDCDKVIVDDVKGAYDATNLLIQKGKKNILLITTQDHIVVGKLRTQGYERALKNNDIKLDQALILKVDGDDRSEKFFFNLEKLILNTFKNNSQINGVFAVNDEYAGIVLRALKKLNLSIPQDVSVVCFTDGVISRFSSPSITAVRQHGIEIGRNSATKLIERIENDDNHNLPYRVDVISTIIIEREST